VLIISAGLVFKIKKGKLYVRKNQLSAIFRLSQDQNVVIYAEGLKESYCKNTLPYLPDIQGLYLRNTANHFERYRIMN
jgi:hypothetical protein